MIIFDFKFISFLRYIVFNKNITDVKKYTTDTEFL